MPHRQHEAVAIRPDRVFRIEPQETLPQTIRYRRQRHGRAGMTGVGLLDRIHAQRADRVNAQLVD
jgi:hypothetical protein